MPGAVLTHRYSFDTDASDLIGGANGTLQGNAMVTNGAVLIGSGGGVGLPANLFTNYDSITFEAWCVDQNFANIDNDFYSITSYWQYLYNFSGAGGEMNYANISFRGDNSSAGSWSQSGTSITIGVPLPIAGRTNHLVWTEDANSQTACLYMNGVLAGQVTNVTLTPALIGPTSTNEIGTSSSGNTNAYFNGSILEFRVYQGALSALEVAQSDAAGPDQPGVDPGSLQDVRIVLPSPIGPGALLQPVVYADFANLINVNVISQPDMTLSSDNTNVIVVTANQKLMTVGLGTVNITAIYEGFTNTVTATVSVPQDIALIHRYGFNEPTNTWLVHDSVSGANGRVFGPFAPFYYQGPAISWVSFTGNGELSLQYPYNWAANHYQGAYVALPGGILSCLSEVSIEAWLTWTPGRAPLTYGGDAWEMVFDFGSDLDLTGITYFFLTPATDPEYKTTKSVIRSGITTNYNNAETPLLDWTNVCPTNVLSLLTVTYSPVREVAKLYLNGALCSSGVATIPLSGITDTNNWLGRSQFGDPYFTGKYNEFRMYSGLLSDSDVQADYNAGPDVVGVDFVLHTILGSTNLTLSWGPSAASWVLESSPALGAGAAWAQVTFTSSNAPSFQNRRLTTSLPMVNDSQYFRLRSP
jgi:hypothetical protein